MATIQELKTKILNANTLGRTNLSEKGVELPETATTYEIMSKIAEISGSGVEYTNSVALLEDIHSVSDTTLINPLSINLSNTLAQLVEE